MFGNRFVVKKFGARTFLAILKNISGGISVTYASCNPGGGSPSLNKDYSRVTGSILIRPHIPIYSYRGIASAKPMSNRWGVRRRVDRSSTESSAKVIFRLNGQTTRAQSTNRIWLALSSPLMFPFLKAPLLLLSIPFIRTLSASNLPPSAANLKGARHV